MKEMLKEVLDRTRRIETALCRHIAGKPDQKTRLKVEVWYNNGVCEAEVNSLDISLQSVVDAARAAGCGEEGFLVCDNGKPRLSIREVRGMSRDNP